MFGSLSPLFQVVQTDLGKGRKVWLLPIYDFRDFWKSNTEYRWIISKIIKVTIDCYTLGWYTRINSRRKIVSDFSITWSLETGLFRKHRQNKLFWLDFLRLVESFQGIFTEKIDFLWSFSALRYCICYEYLCVAIIIQLQLIQNDYSYQWPILKI